MAWVPLLHLRRGPTSLGIPTTLMDCEPSYSCQIRRLRLAPSESSHGRKRAKLSVLSPMSAFGPKRTSPVAPHMSALTQSELTTNTDVDDGATVVLHRAFIYLYAPKANRRFQPVVENWIANRDA